MKPISYCTSRYISYRSVHQYRYTHYFILEKIPAVSDAYRLYRQNPAVSASKKIHCWNISSFYFLFFFKFWQVFKGNMVIVLNPNSNPKVLAAQPSFYLSHSLSAALCLSLSRLLCLSVYSCYVSHSLSRLLILCSLSLGQFVSWVSTAISHF